MPRVRDVLAKELVKFTSTFAAPGVVAALSAVADKPVGELDVVEARALLTQVEVGVKTFGRAAPTASDRAELRKLVTGGATPRHHEEVVRVKSDSEVLRVQSRCLALCRGFFSSTDSVRLATAASELARNIYMYAKEGEVKLTLSEEAGFVRFEVVATDHGPGIANLEEVLSGHYVSRTGLGKGLRGTKSLFDSCDIVSAPGRGTRVAGFKRVRLT